MGDQVTAIEAAIRRLLELAHNMEPDQVPRLAADLAESAGLRDVEIFLVDRQQMELSSLTSSARHAVEGTLVGDTYRRRREHVVDEEGGAQRIYVPLVDGEDRLGVLSAVVDDATVALIEDVQLLASVTAGLIVSKRHYTDSYEFAAPAGADGPRGRVPLGAAAAAHALVASRAHRRNARARI